MNRKNLTTAVLAGLAGAAGIAATATAQDAPTMSLNPDGLGQVLLYPYYTTNGGNNTLLSVVNTTGASKAIKVRFMEGQNTREVLDFNLYMSPYDVWTAALLDGSVVDANCDIDNGLGLGENGQCGVPHLLTADTSCTVPYLFEAASTAPGLQSFLPFKYTGDDADGGPTDIARASEGHFEMIEMGELEEGGTFAAAVKHTTVDSEGDPQDAMPANCAALVDAWTRSTNPAQNGDWIVDPTDELEAPAGGLFGGAAIINVENGFMFSYDAKAINGFANSIDPLGVPLHAEPGTVEPSLNSSDVFTATVFLDDGSVLASTGLTRSVDAVSFLFMHDQVANEYSTEAGINGQTEWVMTFPTKSFYVDPDVNGEVSFPDAVAPFVQAWGGDDDEEGILATACEPVILGIIPDREGPRDDVANPYIISGIFDREEQSVSPEFEDRPPIVSPAPPEQVVPVDVFELCYETNIIRFGELDEASIDADGTEIFGSTNFTNFDNEALGFEAGWVNVELNTYQFDDGGSLGLADREGLGGLSGLPITGFSAQKFGNNNATAGIAAFYGGIYQHKGTRLQSAVSTPVQ